MAQIKILDKEKDYLLSVDPVAFVERLYSKSIFYELLNYDLRNQDTNRPFNNITLIGLYNFILNLVVYNFYEGLMFRHSRIYNKQSISLVLGDLWLKIYPLDYLNEETAIDYNFKEYEYYFSTAYAHSTKIKDKIDRSLIKGFGGNIKHGISIKYTQRSDDFLAKMLILYQDFADNIPI